MLLLTNLHHPLSNCSPFVPPSDHNCQTSAHVDISTPVAAPQELTADMFTHVDPVVVIIPCHSAQKDSNLSSCFNPLPCGVISPINIDILRLFLSDHPDQSLVKFLLNGFTHGFDIGYRGPVTQGQTRNLLSARENIPHVTEAIRKELSRGHTAGPFSQPPFDTLHCSPLGAVPKKDGTYRIILDLSSPRGSSINEFISSTDFSVRYSSFDDAVQLVSDIGPSCVLAKLDIKHAFRLCPVRPSDWPLLGYQWLDGFFIDTRLPFGSRSSPFIFNKFADALLWILTTVFNITFMVHYLDDFLICNVSHAKCKEDMDCMQSVFSQLGVPLAPDKVIGPSTCLTYLGIEIDSHNQSIRLPPDKLADLITLLHSWSAKKKCTKRELLSLLGSLSFACKVVKPGRMFLRRLIDLSTTVHHINHRITLNTEARADITWWITFLPTWNGKELIQSAPVTSYSKKLFTDASLLGFGSVYNNQWFSKKWPAPYKDYHINFLELFAIVASVFTWGHDWANQQILFYTDNLCITNVWRSGTCINKDIMRLVRALFYFTAKNNINILMHHIPGQTNTLADLLSRLQVDRFHRLHPSAESIPTPISPDVWLI